MTSNIDEDDFPKGVLMSYKAPEGNMQDVQINESLSELDKVKLNEFLDEHKNLFGYFEKGSLVSSATTAVKHQIATDGSIVSAKPYR